MRTTGFFQLAMNNLQDIAEETTQTLDNIALHVKPDDSLRTPTFFKMFKSEERELDINTLKNLILKALRSDLYKNVQQMESMKKERVRQDGRKSSGKKEYLSITSSGTVNYILSEEKAIENIKSYFLQQLASNGASIKVLETVADAIGEQVADIKFDTLSDIVGTHVGLANTMMINGAPVSLNTAFKAVQDIVRSIESHIPKGGDDEKKYKAIAEVGNFFDFVSYKAYTGSGKKGNYWSDLGSVFEAIIAAGLRDLGEQVNLIGSNKDIQEYNTSDIEILTRQVISAVDGMAHSLGVSIKHTVNFSKDKAISETNYNKLYDIMGVDQIKGEEILRQYKYFILNYSLLSDFEIEGQKNMGLRALGYTNTLAKHQEKENERANSKNIQPRTLSKKHVARQDDNIRSHMEIVQLYEMYSMLLGRIFLTMSLIGDITQRLTGYTDNQGVATAIPMVLIDQNYAIFTYDVLMNLKTLLGSGDVALTINTAGSRGTFSTLHLRKLQAIFTKKKAYNYTTLIRDEDVNKNIDILNKSAFQQRTKNKSGSITVSNILRINSAIDMAGTIERLSSSGIYAGMSRS